MSAAVKLAGAVAVYRMYDVGNALLYVGQSLAPSSRFANHYASLGDSAQAVRTITIEWHPNRADAVSAERLAIINERPLWNLQHLVPRDDRRWSAEEIKYLEQHCSLGREVLAAALGRTVKSVYGQAYRRGVSLRRLGEGRGRRRVGTSPQ